MPGSGPRCEFCIARLSNPAKNCASDGPDIEEGPGYPMLLMTAFEFEAGDDIGTAAGAAKCWMALGVAMASFVLALVGRNGFDEEEDGMPGIDWNGCEPGWATYN